MRVPVRQELLYLAAEHNILILEDSPYRMVSPGPHLPEQSPARAQEKRG
jgi:(S)-3,5-dihydroxyphenylglycine transaminase